MALEKIVFGTSGIGGVWGEVNPAESVDTILMALDEGVQHIDTAPAYGRAEEFLGQAIRRWSGPLPVISSKVTRLQAFAPDHGIYDYSREGMLHSVELSLERLGIQSLDILFLHDPAHLAPELAAQVIDTLLEIQQKGYAKKLGIGGNMPVWLPEYLTPSCFTALMEFNRLNACSTAALTDSIPFCERMGMEYYAASPLNMGLLGNKFEQFCKNYPNWLDKDQLDIAIQCKRIADSGNTSLSTLSHRFMLTIPAQFKPVIGAANREELSATLRDLAAGPLSESVFYEIVNAQTNTA